MEKYIEAMKAGKEVVIISENENNYSAMFWYSDGLYHSFNIFCGNMKRPDITDDVLKEHIQNMLLEGSHIFIRGYAE